MACIWSAMLAFGLVSNLSAAFEFYPYMMMGALDSVIGFGKFGSM
jgi:hypothetical protein